MAREVRTGLKTEGDLIAALVEATTAFHERHLQIQIANGLKVCESPVERVLMAALLAYNYAQPDFMSAYISGRGGELREPPFDGLHIYPQVSVDGYRLDFLAIYQREGEPTLHTVVEVDGHDFHERTKQQASHDKRRDRHFAHKGWKVLRYTGSDVWRDANACAHEIFVIAQGSQDEL